MNPNRLTERARDALIAAQELAQERNSSQVEPEHLLYALLDQADGVAPQIVRAMGKDPAALLTQVEQELDRLPKVYGSQLSLSQRLNRVLSAADEAAKTLHDDYISTEHMLLALCDQRDGAAGRLLERSGVTREQVLAAADQDSAATSASPTRIPRAPIRPSSGTAATSPSWPRQGKLDPVIGRDEEIRRVIQVLSRRTKNNPVLIGEPGVGKTAIVEGLGPAHRPRRRARGAEGQAASSPSTWARWSPARSTAASSRSG